MKTMTMKNAVSADMAETAVERAMNFSNIERIVNELYAEGERELAHDLTIFALTTTLADPDRTEVGILLDFCIIHDIEVRFVIQETERGQDAVDYINSLLAEGK